LSVDLPFLHAEATGVSTEMAGKWLLLIEKLVIEKLDEDARDDRKGAEELSMRTRKISLDGEMVGR
jgi:hypothetical protein